MIFISPGNVLPGAGAKSLAGVLYSCLPYSPHLTHQQMLFTPLSKYTLRPALLTTAPSPSASPLIAVLASPPPASVVSTQRSQEEPYKAGDPSCHSPKHPPMASSHLTQGPALCSLPRTSLTSAPASPVAMAPPRQSGVSSSLEDTVLMLPVPGHSSPTDPLCWLSPSPGCPPALPLPCPTFILSTYHHSIKIHVCI